MPVLLLGLLVVLAGLAIGGFAGRLTAMHAHLPTSVPSISPVPTETPSLAPVATPTPKTTPTPKPSPSPKPTPKASAKASPTASPSPTPTPTPTSKPTPTPSSAPSAPPRPRAAVKPAEAAAKRTARPSPPPAAAVTGSGARALVRVYLADLARGDSAGAAALLASGSPDTFIDGTLQIGSVTSTPAGNGAQSVTAQIIVGVKHYTMTFSVGERGGALRILSHQATSATPTPP